MYTRNLAALLLAFGLLAGCAAPSVITLIDGREIQTLDQPQYEEDSGFYEYQQLDGKRARINKDQVRSVTEL